MVTSLLKITWFTIISKSKYFKFIFDYESSAFTRSIYKKYTAVLKLGERFEQNEGGNLFSSDAVING